ncbi:MAG: carbohydrate kinase family protein [Gammaproteobacteria bacterium]|nr:carbohydrate kinase family protein [Gammaproteobacteria bacterium]
MNTLITGSLAFDTIMVFEDQFKNHILPEQTHILNVSFFAPQMKRYMGGCAGNIAYTLKLLGGQPIIMATVGDDFGSYRTRLQELGLDGDHIRHIEGQFTAQAFITTDIDHNQIIAFHPGAMNFAHENSVTDADAIELGIVAPNGRDAMLQHSQQFSEAGIPFLFDPGQGLPMFDGDELLAFMEQANYAIVNDYESQMLMDKTGSSFTNLAQRVEALIVTQGAKGSKIYIGDDVVEIASAPIERAEDPTGCGDAYRAGLMHGMTNKLDWKSCGQIASLCGAIKIEHAGTQNHSFTEPEFARRYQSAYGEKYPL